MNPEKYALALMDALFSNEERAQCSFIPSNKSVMAPLCKNTTKIITGLEHYKESLGPRGVHNYECSPSRYF